MLNVAALLINCKIKFNGMIILPEIVNKMCQKVGNGKTLTISKREKNAKANLRTERRKIKNKMLKKPMNKLNNNNNELFVTLQENFALYLVE